jgi:hypothetical protein
MVQMSMDSDCASGNLVNNTSQITKALDISPNTAKRTMTESKGLGIIY